MNVQLELLTSDEAEAYLSDLQSWEIVESVTLYKEYSFENFKKAMVWVTTIGALAEKHGHHPDVALGWGYVRVSLTTHSKKGLTEKDFLLAKDIDKAQAGADYPWWERRA